MTIEDKNSRINIVGAGVMGLSLTLTLLEAGYTDIHLFDKRNYHQQGYDYTKGCDSPSSDLNKVFRTAYGKAKHYQKMAEESHDLFLRWNDEIQKSNWENGSPIYLNTGWLNITDAETLEDFERSNLKNLGEDSIDISSPNAILKAKHKGLSPKSIDPFHVQNKGLLKNGVLDTTGGMIIASKSCRWVLYLIDQLNTNGQLKYHWGQNVILLTENSPDGKRAIGVATEDTVHHLAPLNVVAAGPWVSELVPEAGQKIEATAGTVALFKIDDPHLLKRFDVSNSPTWAFNISEPSTGCVYGFPVTDGYLKIGFKGTKFTNPLVNVNSKVKTRWSKDSEENVPLFGLICIKNFVRKYIPEIKRISVTRMCWYADTEDNEYLISYVPQYTNKSLFVMGGDSGHAFKMLGTLGGYVLDVLNDQGDEQLKQIWSWERTRPRLNKLNLKEANPNALTNVKMSNKRDWWINEPCKL